MNPYIPESMIAVRAAEWQHAAAAGRLAAEAAAPGARPAGPAGSGSRARPRWSPSRPRTGR
jgi:hypothetical protein